MAGCAGIGCKGVYLSEYYGYKGGYCMVAGEPLRKPDMQHSMTGEAKDTYSMIHNFRSKARAMSGFRFSR